MARTQVETIAPDTELTPVQDKNLNELVEAGNQMSIANAAVIDNFDVIKAIGRIEAARFYETVSEKLIAETAIAVKQGKQYKGLPYKDADGNVKHVSDFGEFCEAFFGKSYRRVHQLVENYNTLGSDMYEQAERMGFRQRDYNALKALPADDKLLIAQAIEEENLGKALDLMQEMAARHVHEKELLTQTSEELVHTLEAKDKVIKDKTGIIDNQAERLALLENKQRSVSAEQRLLDLRSNLQIAAADIKVNVMTRLRKCVKDLYDAELEGDNEAMFMAGCLIEIGRELAILRDEYSLPACVDEDLTPEWMRDGAMDDIEEQYAGTVVGAQSDSEE